MDLEVGGAHATLELGRPTDDEIAFGRVRSDELALAVVETGDPRSWLAGRALRFGASESLVGAGFYPSAAVWDAERALVDGRPRIGGRLIAVRDR